VKVTFELVTGLYVSSPAFVAAIKHVPLVEAVIVADADESERAQPVADPPEAIAYVTAPEPEPPVVERLKTWL
jgi:hypothetical protein